MKIFQRKPAQLLGGGAVHIDASKSRSVDADYPWEAAQATNQGQLAGGNNEKLLSLELGPEDVSNIN